MKKKAPMTWMRTKPRSAPKLTENIRHETKARLLAHAEKHYAGKYTRLDIRFRGAFCYIDAYQEPAKNLRPVPGSGETLAEYRERLRNTPTHLCRLEYHGHNRWTLGFFTYSNMKYERCVFHSGRFHGTPEEGLDAGAMYLEG